MSNLELRMALLRGWLIAAWESMMRAESHIEAGRRVIARDAHCHVRRATGSRLS